MKKFKYNAPILEVIEVETEEVMSASQYGDIGLGDDDNTNPNGPNNYRSSWNNNRFSE